MASIKVEKAKRGITGGVSELIVPPFLTLANKFQSPSERLIFTLIISHYPEDFMGTTGIFVVGWRMKGKEQEKEETIKEEITTKNKVFYDD